MRVTCPDCKTPVLLDDAAAGGEAECPRCRGTIRVPDLDRPGTARGFDAPAPPWRGRGVTALVFGLLSVPGALCCGLGGLFGIVAFVLGVISFRTLSRGPAITGALFGAVGVVLSLGVVMFVGILQSAMNRAVDPPAVDGAQPPFVQKL
jgi:hypothetical protein